MTSPWPFAAQWYDWSLKAAEAELAADFPILSSFAHGIVPPFLTWLKSHPAMEQSEWLGFFVRRGHPNVRNGLASNGLTIEYESKRNDQDRERERRWMQYFEAHLTDVCNVPSLKHSSAAMRKCRQEIATVVAESLGWTPEEFGSDCSRTLAQYNDMRVNMRIYTRQRGANVYVMHDMLTGAGGECSRYVGSFLSWLGIYSETGWYDAVEGIDRVTDAIVAICKLADGFCRQKLVR